MLFLHCILFLIYENDKVNYHTCLFDNIIEPYLFDFFDYLFRLSNLNYDNLQEFFKLASFLFQNNNDNKLINLIDFRLFNIEKNKLSQNDIFFLNQIIQQINMIIQNRNDVNIKNDYKILLSKIHYKLNNDSEAINILNEILQINPDNKKAKQLQEIINKKL